MAEHSSQSGQPSAGGGEQRQSAYGFRNIRPLSRAERRAQKDKVALEYSRLQERVGWEARLHQKNSFENAAAMVSAERNAAGYMPDSDRFHTDVAGEEKRERQARIEHQRKVLEHKRTAAVERDQERWRKHEQSMIEEEEYWDRQRQLGDRTKKNQSALPFDILNLKYHDTLAGEEQRHADELTVYRAKVRSCNLVKHGDSRVSYNIINGDNRSALAMPERPQPSQHLATEMARRKALQEADGSGGL